MPKFVKLNRKDDIASVIRKIKDLKDTDIVFSLPAGSTLLSSSNNLKLMKRAGEVSGKNVAVEVPDNDDMAKILARKAGVLHGHQEEEIKPIRPQIRVARSDVKPRFSDIMGARPVARKIPVEEEEPSKFALPSLKSIVKMPAAVVKPTSNSMKYFMIGLVAVVLVLLALAIFLPQATVKVFARSEPVTRDFEIGVDKNAPTVNTAALQIPAIAVDKEVSQTKTFAATGVKTNGAKATGSVQIYNFTGNTLTLKAATTTLVADGKKFLFTKDATGIRATKGTPSNPDKNTTTTVSIVAEQGGEDYNLPANTRFQIVNSALGNQNVYAINPAVLAGGSAGAGTTVVSQQDLDQAAASLTSEVLNQTAADLTETEGLPVIVLPSGVKMNVLTKTSSKQAGEAAESFSMTLIAKVTGLAFRQSDVTNLVIGKINEVLSADKYLLTDNGQTKYTAEFKTIDFDKGQGVLAVHFETVAAYKIDEDSFRKLLSGKNESEIKEILLSKPEVDNVEVTFWPAWLVHKAPRINGKIYIQSQISPKTP